MKSQVEEKEEEKEEEEESLPCRVFFKCSLDGRNIVVVWDLGGGMVRINEGGRRRGEIMI